MAKKLKKYINYLSEASLEDNPGVPKKVLNDIGARGKADAEDFKRNNFRELVSIMPNVGRIKQLQRGHEEGLEKIAEETIREYYGSILDGVDLVIKFPTPGEIKITMSETPPEPPEALESVTDQSTIDEINKRKILKNIMQGEAKNSKRMLNLPDVKEKIVALMGDSKGTEYLGLLNRVITAASIADWDVPLEVQKDLWQRSSASGEFAGAVKVTWEEEEETPDELAKKILDELEDKEEIPEETEDLFNEVTPTIYAYGLDFAMLLHETIKGIYNLIISLSIPTDPNVSEIVIMNTDTLADELEDLRYGPVFAANLRDAINEFPEVDEIDNLREHVVGKLSIMPAKEFLDFMLMFFNGDKKAKTILKNLIDEVKSEMDEYKSAMVDHQLDNAPTEEYENDDDVIDDEPISPVRAPITDMMDQEEDYSDLAPSRLQKLIDDAMDREDWGEVSKLSKYLKESRRYKK